MTTRRAQRFLATAAFLGLASLAAPAAYADPDGVPGCVPGTCGSFPTPLPAGGSEAAARIDLSRAIVGASDRGAAAVVGSLAQTIVEAELGHAAVRGGFEPRISASLDGTDLDLEVCRDAIVGEVAVAGGPRMRFVVGDFDRDGMTDVAVRRLGNATWTLETSRSMGGWVDPLGPAVEAEGSDPVTRPGSAQCVTAWLADGPVATPAADARSDARSDIGPKSLARFAAAPGVGGR